jgi:L-glyceraldehyde 3-phosphate reductase
MLDRLHRLNAVAADRGQTLAQMALAWVLKDSKVTSVIVGASSTAQLDDNLDAIRNTYFSAEEKALIDELTKQ